MSKPPIAYPKKLYFMPKNEKVFSSLTYTDTAMHYLNLPYTEAVRIVLLTPVRTTGTGSLKFYPDEGYYSVGFNWTTLSGVTTIAVRNNRLLVQLTVANDVFDVYCFGYWYEE